ncbi:MAG: DUF3329 domain-containing protein [Gammaproteobacteria bacterium]|nr:DUF3329 domain-containing protein [Gammaproteobacteria bacterium]
MNLFFIDWKLLGFTTGTALLIGLSSGNYWFWFCMAMLTYIVVQSIHIRELATWVSKGSKLESAPDLPEFFGDIVSKIYRIRRSDRKRYKRTKAKLEWFNKTAEFHPDATVILNSELEVIWANAKSSELLNIANGRDNGLRILNIYRDPALTGLFKHLTTTNEVEIRSPLFSNVTLAIRATPFADGDVFVTARDISARIENQRSRRAFVDNASHELRTPLTVINGYLEMLDDDPSLVEHVQHQVKTMREQSQQMVNIVQDMLTLSKLEGTELMPNQGEWIDLSAHIESWVKAAAETGRFDHHTLDLELDRDVRALVIASEIESVYTNLINNAVAYTPAGSRIQVRLNIKADYLRLAVIDNGPGIPARHLPHLMERFYRVDSGRSRQSGGTGLGLAICKHVMQRHGGTLTVKSRLGRGTVFTATLPSKRVTTIDQSRS